MRGKKHLELLKSKSKESVLWKHCIGQHEAKVSKFKMNVMGRFGGDSMMRQITEGIKIENMEVGRIMNERTEWNMTRVNKVNVDVN